MTPGRYRRSPMAHRLGPARHARRLGGDRDPRGPPQPRARRPTPRGGARSGAALDRGVIAGPGQPRLLAGARHRHARAHRRRGGVRPMAPGPVGAHPAIGHPRGRHHPDAPGQDDEGRPLAHPLGPAPTPGTRTPSRCSSAISTLGSRTSEEPAPVRMAGPERLEHLTLRRGASDRHHGRRRRTTPGCRAHPRAGLVARPPAPPAGGGLGAASSPRVLGSRNTTSGSQKSSTSAASVRPASARSSARTHPHACLGRGSGSVGSPRGGPPARPPPAAAGTAVRRRERLSTSTMCWSKPRRSCSHRVRSISFR